MLSFRNIIVILFVLPLGAAAQFAPGAGQAGTTAVFKDSSVFKAWATTCTVNRGFINIEDTTATYTQGDTTSNRAFFGNAGAALGAPGGALDVVSLGDGGIATLGFAQPITNGAGPDFAVFENGFAGQTAPFGDYLELAFVEVSTDGKRFVRFPAVSLTQDSVQIDSFGQLDATRIHNLAGKYVANYGTPFDLDEVADSTGIDVDSICFVRIVDVVGDLHDDFARFDAQGHKINDPWPTPYWSGGFDLDAVGVIHQTGHVTGISSLAEPGKIFRIYPNPASRRLNIRFLKTTGNGLVNFDLLRFDGRVLMTGSNVPLPIRLDVSQIPNGLCFLRISRGENRVIRKILIRH